MKKLELKVNGIDLVAWIAEQDGEQLVAVRPICDALGLASNKQIKKLASDPQFSCNHMVSTGTDGKHYEMFCIPVKKVSRWLLGINSKKVKAEIAPQLIAFQDNLQDCINAYIRGDLSYEHTQKLDDTTAQLKDALKKIDMLEQENWGLRQNNNRLEKRIVSLEENGQATNARLDDLTQIFNQAATLSSHGMHVAKKVKRYALIQGGAV